MVRPSVFMELLCDVNADLFSAAGDVLKLHLAVDLCKQGIVRTDTDIVAGMSLPFLVEPTPFLWAKNCKPNLSISYTSLILLGND